MKPETEGARQCVGCGHNAVRDTLCREPVRWDESLGREILCLHRCEFPSQPVGDGEHDKMLEFYVEEIEEMQRLESLTPLALIHEVLKTDVADDPRVTELMNRVLPGYENIAADGSVIDPTYVSTRIPTPVGAQPTQPSWLPMETIPRDGSDVLLYRPAQTAAHPIWIGRADSNSAVDYVWLTAIGEAPFTDFTGWHRLPPLPTAPPEGRKAE